MNPEKIRNTFKKNFFGRFFLFSLSKFYFIATAIRKTLYKNALLISRKAGKPVVCFGNISSGGTGKTSSVIMAATELKKLGKNPAVIMRGYKSREKIKGPLLVGIGGDAYYKYAGDEAALIHASLKDLEIPVVVNPDRYEAAKFAVDKFSPDIILMDDGFQHFGLKRDLDILLVNASSAGEEELLPLGNLREPYSAAKRAGLAILTHCENSSEKKIETLRTLLKSQKNDLEVIESSHEPDSFLSPLKGERLPSRHFQGREAVALSAIGDPDSFENMLGALGVKIKKSWRFPDHHTFTLENLKAVSDTAEGLPVITTYKDFVRFPQGWDMRIKSDLFILSIKVSYLSKGYKILMDKLTEILK